MPFATGLTLTPSDSARAIGEVYSVSLLTTIPLLIAVLAFVVLRNTGPGTRVLIWRSAIAALVVVSAGRALPFHWMAWVIPEGLAAPLISLGKAQLGVLEGGASARAATEGGPFHAPTAALVHAILIVYWLGVVAVLLPLVVARVGLWRAMLRARVLEGDDWYTLLASARQSTSTRTAVRLRMSDEVRLPVTWGVIRPVILLPRQALGWTRVQREATLLHELSHVRSADALFGTVGRVVCALYWFHPGVWWVARRFVADAEMACDDRVLMAGVRRSDYAELLARAMHGNVNWSRAGVASLVRRRGIRERLAAIVDGRRVLKGPPRSAVIVAAVLTLGVSLPVSTVRVSPTRDVLTTLMRDVQWQARAYAVVRLAQRRDSVEVARAAARHDPSPRVRAWAEYALAQGVTSAAVLHPFTRHN
ncbi:MAG: M56 family metallopeptidase [Gemmatimonadaceae bacterium]